MTANVSIVIAQRENALTIPNGALRFHPPESAVVETNSAVPPPATNSGNVAGSPGGRTSRRPTRAANARFFTRFMCFQARATMRSCRRCRSRPASATAFRPRCFRGWTKARRLSPAWFQPAPRPPRREPVWRRRLPQNALIRFAVQTNPVIKLADIHKVYHTGEVDVHAVRGVSLEIFPGEFVASWARAAPANAR